MSAHGIGQNAVLQHLEEDGGHIPVGLLQLVQQHHRIGPPPDRLGELTALAVAHVAGRRAQQPGYGVLLHIFRHIQPDQSVPAAVDAVGQGLAQGRLAHAGGAQEQQRRHGPLLVGQPHSAPAHGLGHGRHGLLLPQDLPRKGRPESQEPRPVRLGHLSHRYAGPQGDGLGHVLPVHHPLGQNAPLLPQQLLELIANGRRLLEPVLPHGLAQLPVQGLAGRLGPVRQELAAGPGRRLVQHVHGLVRQKVGRQIPAAQIHRRLQRLAADSDSMVPLQTRLQGLQHPEGRLPVRLLHLHRPEPPLQGRVLLDVLAVLLQGRGSEDLHLAPAQGRLQQIGRVNGSLGRARAHQGVHLVHKQDHIAGAVNLRQDIPDPLLELAAILGPGQHGSHVQGKQPLVLQLLRHQALEHPLGQSLGDGRLPYPRLPDQGRVVFTLPAENGNDRVNLPVPAHHGVGVRRLLHHIHTELLQKTHIDAPFRLGPVLYPGLEVLIEIGEHTVQTGAVPQKQLGRRGILQPRDGQQQVLRAHLRRRQPPGLQRRPGQQAQGVVRKALDHGQPRRAPAPGPENLPQRLRVPPALLQHPGRLGPPPLHQRQQQMLAAHHAVAQQHRLPPRRRQQLRQLCAQIHDFTVLSLPGSLPLPEKNIPGPRPPRIFPFAFSGKHDRIKTQSILEVLLHGICHL